MSSVLGLSLVVLAGLAAPTAASATSTPERLSHPTVPATVHSAAAEISPSVALASTPDGRGFWTATASGAVTAGGAAAPLGGMTGQTLNAPIVGLSATPDGGGYWLLGRDGGVFSFGDANFYGSTGNLRLNSPALQMVADPTGGGYWFVAGDGGVFSFGPAPFYGSAGAIQLNRPVVGMATTPGGGGYWLVASDGGIFSYGNAGFHGSTGNLHLNSPIVGMASTPSGNGYWLVAADGGLFAFGDAGFFGSASGISDIAEISATAVGMLASHDGGGYWILLSDGTLVPYGDAASASGIPTLGAGGVWDDQYNPIEYDQMSGYGQVLPTWVFNGGDPTGSVYPVQWQSWGGSTATGTGYSDDVEGNESVAQGQPNLATIVAFDLGDCNGTYMYRAVEWYFPESGQSFDPNNYIDACNATYVIDGVDQS